LRIRPPVLAAVGFAKIVVPRTIDHRW